MVVKWIKITVGEYTYTIANSTFESDVELNNETIRKCLQLVNNTDSPDGYQIKLIANDTILRIKPR